MNIVDYSEMKERLNLSEDVITKLERKFQKERDLFQFVFCAINSEKGKPLTAAEEIFKKAAIEKGYLRRLTAKEKSAMRLLTLIAPTEYGFPNPFKRSGHPDEIAEYKLPLSKKARIYTEKQTDELIAFLRKILKEEYFNVLRLKIGYDCMPQKQGDIAKLTGYSGQQISNLLSNIIPAILKRHERRILDFSYSNADVARLTRIVKDRIERLSENEAVINYLEANEDLKGLEIRFSDKCTNNILIDELDLSTRPFNILKNEGIDTLADLLACTSAEIRDLRPHSKKSTQEVIDLIHKMGHHFKDEE